MLYKGTKNEQIWEIRYVSPKDGTEKTAYGWNEADKNRKLDKCREKGIKVIYCKKMYPINMERNQHNFGLIMNLCSNRMRDMENGDIAWDGKEYDRLDKTRREAEEFFGSYGMWNSSISWFTYEKWQRAKELCMMAKEHRAIACIEAGRADLVQYC